ncbi:MAG: septation protein SpoVG family protein [Planctomycetes bacterium]|nr:septation protein SpoVG family protein [Planctomycetota bacterium]
MEISDVRVRLLTDTNDRLKAVCSVTLDEQFVIRDIKLVDGTGGLFVAMPSRKLSAPCPNCRTQNHLRARYCNECGKQVPAGRIPRDDSGREKAHRDIAHPITSTFRQAIQQRVLDAYEEELGSGPADVDVVEDRDEQRDAPTPEPATPEPTTPEPEPELEPELEPEPKPEVDDYNSMIADLDPGRGRRRRTESRAKPTEQKSERDGNRTPDTGRNRPRRTENSDAGSAEPVEEGKSSSRARPNDRPKSPPPAPSEPARSTSSSTQGRDGADQNDTAFGWGLDEVAQPPPRKRAAPKVEEEKKPAVARPQPPVEDAGGNDSGFGAGIL